MSALSETLTRAYILATRPYRVWIHRKLQRQARVPVASIFLHRIADDYPNDWSMTNQTFDRLIDWLQKNVDLVSIDDAQALILNGNRGRLAVNITFDDGYADNCLHAIPSLLKKKIPFTYYVSTEHIRNGQQFPHDIENGQPLMPNSVEEIQAMADSGVEIGVHTRTHPDMGQVLAAEEIADEIGGAREEIESWIGSTPMHFAFPYGQTNNITDQAIQYVHDQGFRSYVSAYGGYNFPTASGFHLRRFHGDPNLPGCKTGLASTLVGCTPNPKPSTCLASTCLANAKPMNQSWLSADNRVYLGCRLIVIPQAMRIHVRCLEVNC